MATVSANPGAVNTSAVNTSAYYLPTTATTEPSPPGTYYNKPGMYPDSTTPPSTNISPTNFHSSALNVRQLRQPRQPMYIPAALRPTDHPKSTPPTDIPQRRPRAPDTPPGSKNNSFDSAVSSATAAAPSMTDITASPTSCADALDVSRSSSFAPASPDELGPVTGAPTTAHWKPDSACPSCSVCRASFTWFFRRHHCRRCGDVVCDNHIQKRVPLDQNARLHPRGEMSKACDVCWREWQRVKKEARERDGSLASSRSGSVGTALEIPHRFDVPADEARVGSMARSEGMVWSTF